MARKAPKKPPKRDACYKKVRLATRFGLALTHQAPWLSAGKSEPLTGAISLNQRRKGRANMGYGKKKNGKKKK